AAALGEVGFGAVLCAAGGGLMPPQVFLRRSFTRTALPCDRGSSPGALRATLQLTPSRDLMRPEISSHLRAYSPLAVPGAASISTTMVSSAPSRVSTIW